MESPAKAKTINKILGSGYKVTASVGHIIDLPKSDIGVDIDNGYKPKYKVIKGKSGIIKELKNAAKNASGVILATDPDREGEAIAAHIAETIKKVNPNIERIEFNEITKQAVLNALNHSRQIDTARVDAQQARRVMDRIVGYMVSPVLWRTIFRGLSAGRVQSVALRLICEREDEIEGFQPVEYWTVDAHLKTGAGEEFTARLFKIDNKTLDTKKFRIENEKEAQAHYNKLQNGVYTVSDIQKQEVIKRPGPPFITSTLQQDASRRFRMGTSVIMRIAQQLYEGIDLGEHGNIGLITYMRTDSTRISKEALAAVRNYIAGSYGTDFLPEKPQFYKSKKSAQDAHEAIRPTQISKEFEPRNLKKYLTADQYKIYELIWKRFVASQMKPAVAEKTTILVSVSEYLFRAVGEVITFRGFLQAYQPDTESNGKSSDEKEPTDIPRHIEKGEILKLLELLLKQNFTKPPPRFTESTLVKILDNLGIGRPSTYAQIVSTLFQRKYVEREERALKPTELGRTVNLLLTNNFPNIFNVKFTAAMEEALDRVAQKEDTYTKMLDSFYHPFKETLDNVTGKIGDIKQSLNEKTGETCEICGRPMITRWGRNGKFMACSGYPECKNTRPLEEPEPPRESDEKCELCGSPLVVKKGRFGEFLACSRYPDCKFTKPVSTNVPCPEDGCNGTIVQRQSRKGKIFYSCSEYPKCKFALWNKPVAKSCPECNYPLMEEKITKQKGHFYQCPQCKHKELLEESVEKDVD
ncbi:MAG: type I DNA topoisomerase [Calditrichia bacterium]